MKLYVASSWRNIRQPHVVWMLREAGHDVYDFRHSGHSFAWSAIDANWKAWSPRAFRAALEDPIARCGFDADWSAIQDAEAGVLLMPCGRSAHLEAGYFVGAGKPLFILLSSDGEPELMYRMATRVCVSLTELLAALSEREAA